MYVLSVFVSFEMRQGSKITIAPSLPPLRYSLRFHDAITMRFDIHHNIKLPCNLPLAEVSTSLSTPPHHANKAGYDRAGLVLIVSCSNATSAGHLSIEPK